MNVDPGLMTAVVAPVVTAVVTGAGWWASRRKMRAEIDKLNADAAKQRAEAAAISTTAAAAAMQAVQDSYREIISDLRAQIDACAEEATSARAAARDASKRAAESEHNAWRAEQQVILMARFLHELRPLIAQHVPGAETLLERIDKLASAHGGNSV